MGNVIRAQFGRTQSLPIAQLDSQFAHIKMGFDKVGEAHDGPMDPAVRGLSDEMYSILTSEESQRTAGNAYLVFKYAHLFLDGKCEEIREISESQMMAGLVIVYIVVGHYGFHDLLDKLKPWFVKTSFETAKFHLNSVLKNLSANQRSIAAKHAADASHAVHNENRRRVREWYAMHKNMSKDDAAARMFKDQLVVAAYRTIRDYLIDHR